MKFLLALSAAIALACSPPQKVGRPSMDPGRVKVDTLDDQCGDSIPGCPGVNDTLQGNDTVKMQVDSGHAMLFHRTSFGLIGGVIGRPFTAAVQAAEDSSTYVINWKVNSIATGDTVQVRLVRDSVAGKVTRVSITKNRFTATGSVPIVVDRVYGIQASYSACTRLRRTVVKSEYCLLWKTNFPPKAKVDTMWVDSSQAVAYVRGIYVSTPNNFPVQWCLFTKTKDGKMRIASNQRTIWGCQKLYDKFPTNERFADYRGVAFLDGHFNVTIDTKDSTKKKIIIDFIRNWTPA